MPSKKPKLELLYKGPVEGFSKEASVDYWQRLSGEDRLKAGWQMVEDYWSLKGKPKSELRLNRTILLLKRA